MNESQMSAASNAPTAHVGPDLPDVSVIVPVYNTLPYLRQCLDSLTAQSLGLGRVHVVAVDDGSTDGSGQELDRFAADHPGTVVVRHQANSGGPANPCNEGLALATGRYVFFLGSDDYLAEDAMERLVRQADEWASDVIFGTMVGVNDRYVDQRIFSEDVRDLTFVSHPLAYSLSNTKLFRRSLIEAFSIRYPENVTVGEDQLFVLRAILNARRVSVMGGEPFYYAVKRDDDSNLSYSLDWRSRLHDVTAVMEQIAEWVPPGEVRDSIFRRHFHFELGKLLKQDFPLLDQAEQEDLAAAHAGLANRYLTPLTAQRVPVAHRVRARLAQSGQLAILREFSTLPEDFQPPLVLRDGEAFSPWPGFDRCPPEWYQHNPKLIQERIEAAICVDSLALHGDGLIIGGDTEMQIDPGQIYVALVKSGGRKSGRARRVTSESLKARRRFPVSFSAARAGSGFAWESQIRFPLDDLESGATAIWEPRLRISVNRWTYDLPVPMIGPEQTARHREKLSRQTLDLDATSEGNVRVRQHSKPSILPGNVVGWGNSRS